MTLDMEKLAQELRRDEGVRYAAYKDSLGYWTVGVGHLIDPRKGGDPAPFGVDLRNGGNITDSQVNKLLNDDINEAMGQLDNRLPWWSDLCDARQRVLVNMCFNLGIAGLVGFSNTLADIKNENYASASRRMLSTKWASQVGDRAKRLAQMMLTGRDYDG